MKTTIEVELLPFPVPETVSQKITDTEIEETTVPRYTPAVCPPGPAPYSRSYLLRELPAATIQKLCDEFTEAVYKKAWAAPPAAPAAPVVPKWPFTRGDEVLVYDRYRFGTPLRADVVVFSKVNTGVQVKLLESNNAQYPIGSKIWVDANQLRLHMYQFQNRTVTSI